MYGFFILNLILTKHEMFQQIYEINALKNTINFLCDDSVIKISLVVKNIIEIAI